MEVQKLRSGFTTGTCAAAAAGGAAAMLLTGREAAYQNITTPKGTEAHLPLFHIIRKERSVSCGVVKDAGDDPDVTDGALVFASVSYGEPGAGREQMYLYECDGQTLYLDGGQGIGRVTRPGLSCPVGRAAINPVPRQMIFEEVKRQSIRAGYDGPLSILVWIPQGEELAKKTFNPRLGISGGLSVLGTSGVVEPMSEDALLATIRLEIHMRAVEGRRQLIITPGNYGERFLKDQLKLSLDQGAQCSNFVRAAMKASAEEGMTDILFLGHMGKLIKVAGGVPNTHSRYGDRRMEILWECASSAADGMIPDPQQKEELKQSVLGANTTEEAAGLLKQAGLLKESIEEAVRRIQSHIRSWIGTEVNVQVVIFTLEQGLLGASFQAEKLIGQLKNG